MRDGDDSNGSATGRAALADAIEREEAALRELATARETAEARLLTLRAELAASEAAMATTAREPTPRPLRSPRSPVEKVRLFRELFRGRPDVYATRFVSKKTGKPGYGPACSNKFVPGVCALASGMKCGECPNQAFRPLDDAAIVGHRAVDSAI